MSGASEGVASPRRVVLLMGPTGVGKSDLAIQLTQRLPFEIVSVDSALIYRGMDIGTAKPAAAVRRAVTHHLIDIRDPEVTYSAGEFVRDAVAAMEDIWQRGRHPLLVGGTMLYFQALTAGIAPLPERDPAVREEIDARAAAHGWPALHAELAAVDPSAALRIHENDAQRIQRALEVYRLTGQPITTLHQNRRSSFDGMAVFRLACGPIDRNVLAVRLRDRFTDMLRDGFLDEVQRLFARSGLTAEHPSMRAVGYRQLWQHLAGHCNLVEATEQAIAATRQLAKRQMTWLRATANLRWLDSMHSDAASLALNALTEGGFTE